MRAKRTYGDVEDETDRRKDGRTEEGSKEGRTDELYRGVGGDETPIIIDEDVVSDADSD